jgi:hypothetical protein
VARPGYHFFFIRRHSAQQRAHFFDIMALAPLLPALSVSDGSLFI